MKTIFYPHPDVLLDDEGYPTQAALDYIKNWGLIFIDGKFITGPCYDHTDYDDLIEYLQSIWYYHDGVVYQDGLLELHTMGWSGNEEVIRELEKTILWSLRLRATESGGHYYFRIDRNSKQNWRVVKVDCE